MGKVFGPRKSTGVSANTIRFHEVGCTYRGLILGDFKERQATDMKTHELKEYDNGRPVMEFVYDFLTIDQTPCSPNCYQCKRREKEDDPSVQRGRLYAKWSQHKAIQDAIYSNQNPEMYGLLVLRYAADDLDKKKKSQDAPKIYAAAYRNPTDKEVARCEEFLGLMGASDGAEAEVSIQAGLAALMEEDIVPVRASSKAEPSTKPVTSLVAPGSKEKMSFDEMLKVTEEATE